MPKRRKSPFDDLLDLASRLPWKVSVVLALVAFITLHGVAGAFNPLPTVTAPADIGGLVIRQYIHVFASILQFVVPAGFLIGAAVSFIKRSRSASLIDSVRSSGGPDVSSLSWQEFETLVAEGFRQRGFAVKECGGSSPDGGVDLILSRGHEKSLVQCKQWRAQQVGVSVVRELYGVMAAEQAAGGYVVTSGEFTKDAVEFARGRNIELINGTILEELLRKGTGLTRLLRISRRGLLRASLRRRHSVPIAGVSWPSVLPNKVATRASRSGGAEHTRSVEESYREPRR